LFAASVAQGTGDCASQANACSLTTALSDVTPGGTIELVTPGSSAHYIGTFTLSTGTSALPVTIQPASGISDPILDGNNGSATGCPTVTCVGSVLTVTSGVFATISGLSIEGGLTAAGANGGGVDNAGTVTLTNDVVSQNATSTDTDVFDENGGNGGGIYNSGTLTLTDDSVLSNDTAGGGAVSGFGINQGDGNGDSALILNSANGNNGGNGGGIDNTGTLTLTDDTVADNRTGAGGSIGAITITQGNGTADTATMNRVANGTNGGNGGGIENSGTLTLANDTVAGNETGAGGSIAALSITQGNGDNDTATIENSADGANGGNGGGIDNRGTLTLTNDTVADNGTGAGGSLPALSISQGAGNGDIVSLGFDSLGGQGGSGGDIDNGGSATIGATIVASSVSGGDCAGGAMTDQGYSIDADGSCPLTGTGSVSPSATLNGSLSALGPHGGPTDTIAFSSGPAVGLVHSATLCATPDQRGVPRPSPVCDAGAYEFTPVPPSVTIAKSANITSYSSPGTPVTYSYLVTNTGHGTLSNVTVTDPMSGLSSINCGSGTNVDATLTAGSSVTCTASYTTTVADVKAGSITNTGTVIGSPPAGANVTDSSTLTITAKPCGAGLTAHLLTATSRTGSFFGIFCVNPAGTGTYTQYPAGAPASVTATGTGTVTVSGTVTRITAFGKNLALLGQRTSTTSTFTETAPAPVTSGTFTLT
jgi:hypothetical protein